MAPVKKKDRLVKAKGFASSKLLKFTNKINKLKKFAKLFKKPMLAVKVIRKSQIKNKAIKKSPRVHKKTLRRVYNAVEFKELVR